MTTQINVKDVPAELLKQAKIIAVQTDRSLSDVIRELLAQWVKENKSK